MCPYNIAFTTEKYQKPLCIFSSSVVKPHLHSSSKMRFPDGNLSNNGLLAELGCFSDLRLFWKLQLPRENNCRNFYLGEFREMS